MVDVQKKIIIVGLDNSGKSSIIFALLGKNNLSDFSQKPTLGINMENLSSDNVDFTIWEVGGQELYRNKFLDEFDRRIDGVHKIIFVVDVRDKERYDVFIEYFENIIGKLLLHKFFPKVSVFLHKFDPDIEKDPNFSDGILNQNLLNRVNDIIGDDFDLEILKTTIFTVFQKSNF